MFFQLGDNGATYQVLNSVRYETYSNIYTVTFDLIENTKLVVALKGDMDFNGIINGNDVVEVKNLIRSGGAESLSALDAILYNLDGEIILNANDVVTLKNVIRGTESFSW